jgi:FAD:protein FMN transferase
MYGRRQCLRFALGALCSLPALARVAAGDAPDAALQWRERLLQGFGTTLRLRAGDADAQRVERGLDAAVHALREVEAQMSLFDPGSALCRLNRDGVLTDPPPDLLGVLRLARRLGARSQGAFDLTVQPLWRVWARAQQQGRLPSDAELEAARRLVDWRAVDLGPAHAPRVRLCRPGMAITCNGIAQGWAADRARAALQRAGIRHALLDTGEWSALGQGPDGEAWTLGIADPRQRAQVLARLQLRGRAVATSSDAHTRFSADDLHHHILDPRTGRSPPELASVTVAAPNAALADALTKVIFMGGPKRALELAQHWGVDVFVVDKRGSCTASPGLA